jgi:hypothetical protein
MSLFQYGEHSVDQKSACELQDNYIQVGLRPTLMFLSLLSLFIDI